MVAMKVLENLGWILTCTSGFAILIIFSAMAADVGLSNIFCWHPILLSMAFLLYMNEGLLVYFNNNKTDRAVSRYWHGRYMLLATLFSIGGYIAIYISHARENHSQFGIGHAFINALHVWIGYLVLLLMLLQSFVGMSKYFGFAKAKWHGKLGVYIYFGGILNICNVRRVSCLLYMEDNNGYNLSIFWPTGSIIVVSHGFISESESSIS